MMVAGSLPLPEEDLVALLRRIETIAVVGASDNEEKQAHRIPAYLRSQGYRIVPVNPNADRVLGEPAAASLDEIVVPVDVVQVFRPPEETPEIARQAAAIGADVLWLQLGISSEEAERIGREAGMMVVMDTCLGAVHRKLAQSYDLSG